MTDSTRPTPWIPLGDGWSKGDEATASCYCGAVQLSFSMAGDNLGEIFICNCTDCRKITASMFATNFLVKASAIKHVRGQEKLTKFARDDTIATGNTMESHFCSVCGTLMYRISSGFPDLRVLRVGTVDDYNLQETKLKPRVEQFGKDRVAWCGGGKGVKQFMGNFLGDPEEKNKEVKANM